jgi:hypothetical protein
MVDAAERLEVLLKQETSHYLTFDYLSRMRSDPTAGKRDAAASGSKKRKSLFDEEANNSKASPTASNGTGVNAGCDESAASQISKQWREKICEWAYQGKEMTREPAHARILMHLTRHGSFIL